MKQAMSATTAARSFMQQRGEISQNETNEAHDKEVSELKEKVQELEDKLSYERKDKSALKSQAENLSKSYDTLAEEHSSLQKKLTAGGDNDNKKDD